MELKILTYIVVGLTFALYIGIAFWARAGSTSEFYVSGRGINPVANGMATAADWMSAASFISMAGLIAFMGYGGSIFLMGWTGGYVLLAMLLAPYLRKIKQVHGTGVYRRSLLLPISQGCCGDLPDFCLGHLRNRPNEGRRRRLFKIPGSAL